jgi:hypothetical protein
MCCLNPQPPAGEVGDTPVPITQDTNPTPSKDKDGKDKDNKDRYDHRGVSPFFVVKAIGSGVAVGCLNGGGPFLLTLFNACGF